MRSPGEHSGEHPPYVRAGGGTHASMPHRLSQDPNWTGLVEPVGRLRGELDGIWSRRQWASAACAGVAEQVSFGIAGVGSGGRRRETVGHLWGVVGEVELDDLGVAPVSWPVGGFSG
jgi:hypothetical protein